MWLSSKRRAVVNISGRRDHAIVEHGKQILMKLQHRGAAGADESTEILDPIDPEELP